MLIKLPTTAFMLALTLAVSAYGDDLNVQLVNNTDKAITSVTATLKGATERSTANVLAGEIAPSETGAMTIPHAEDECLFDLQITFGEGAVADRPDIDLCQADGIVIE
jgi:hypothetical protein